MSGPAARAAQPRISARSRPGTWSVPLGRDPLVAQHHRRRRWGGQHHLVNPLGSFGQDFLNGLAKDWQHGEGLGAH